MELLLFYISQVFGSFHLPLASEVCASSDSIRPMCQSAINFTLFFIVFAFVITIVVWSKKITNNYALVVFTLLRIIACFLLADHALREIQDPIRFGLEWFTLIYYLWCFILLNAYLSLILFPSKTKLLLGAVITMTIILIPVFAYTGRGNFQQITPLAGGLFGELSLKMLWLSFSFKFFIALILTGLVSGFVLLLAGWVKTGGFNFLGIKRNLALCGIFLIILILPVASIPIGEMYNKRDIQEAENYINAIKTKADKYFYENGEYPKFIEKLIPAGRSPRLLERHEFFTYGIKGTYYFSRKDKYCFLFQNPSRKFGYYSITSEREWRYAENADSYDDVFINLCDESNKSFEDLISNHLGVSDQDKILNAISADTGTELMPATSSKAGMIIEEKVKEGGQADPELLKYIDKDEKSTSP